MSDDVTTTRHTHESREDEDAASTHADSEPREVEDAPTGRAKAQSRGAVSSEARKQKLIPVVLALGISAIQMLFMFCLAYAPLNATPKEVPIGIVATGSTRDHIETQLDDVGKDAIDIHYYSTADRARDAIKDRDIYGAIVVSDKGSMSMLVSSAANPTIANLLKTKATEIATKAADEAAKAAAANGQGNAQATPAAPPLTVEDVVPASDDDPNGAGFLATVLPLTLLSLALGVGVALLEKRPTRAVGLIGMASLTTAIGVGWIAAAMGIFTYNYWGTVGVLLALVFGIAATSAGFTYFGRGGRALDLCFALLLLCVGIPGAGALVPSLLLVEPWRGLGQVLPPGAAVNSLRGINFFDGTAIEGSVWVLVSWAFVGLALTLLSTVWMRRQAK